MSEWPADCFLIQQKVRWNYFTASLILCRKMTKLFVERGVICHLCNDAILRRPFSIKRFCQLFGIRTRIVGICRWDCWPLDYHGPPRLTFQVVPPTQQVPFMHVFLWARPSVFIPSSKCTYKHKNRFLFSVIRKNRQMSIKVAQIWLH